MEMPEGYKRLSDGFNDPKLQYKSEYWQSDVYKALELLKELAGELEYWEVNYGSGSGNHSRSLKLLKEWK